MNPGAPVPELPTDDDDVVEFSAVVVVSELVAVVDDVVVVSVVVDVTVAVVVVVFRSSFDADGDSATLNDVATEASRSVTFTRTV